MNPQRCPLRWTILPLATLVAFAQSPAPVVTVSVSPPAGVAVSVSSPAAVLASQPTVSIAAPGSATSAIVTVASPVVPPVTPPVGTAPAPAASGETSVALDVGFGIRAVPPSRITVPVGEYLRITAPNLGDTFTYLWTKDGRALAGRTDQTLTIPSVVSSDAGTYACQLSTPTRFAAPSQSLVLGVGPIDRLLNLSTRLTLGAGPDQTVILGFVVAASSQPKKLIVRAIGPSLSLFGVTNLLRAPVLRIFDGNGKPYENGYAYPAVVGGPTYESDLADSLVRAGAFSIPAGTRDAVVMMPFQAGSYTAQVSSGDGTAGTVLLEIYEVP